MTDDVDPQLDLETLRLVSGRLLARCLALHPKGAELAAGVESGRLAGRLVFDSREQAVVVTLVAPEGERIWVGTFAGGEMFHPDADPGLN